VSRACSHRTGTIRSGLEALRHRPEDSRQPTDLGQRGVQSFCDAQRPGRRGRWSVSSSSALDVEVHRQPADLAGALLQQASGGAVARALRARRFPLERSLDVLKDVRSRLLGSTSGRTGPWARLRVHRSAIAGPPCARLWVHPHPRSPVHPIAPCRSRRGLSLSPSLGPHDPPAAIHAELGAGAWSLA